MFYHTYSPNFDPVIENNLFFYHGSSDDEVAAGVDVVLGLSVEVLLRDADLDHLLHDVIAELGQGDLKIKFIKI
jgi:hypothetical protein